MATVTGPDGATFEETSLTALAYYQREPGFTVGETLPAESVELIDGNIDAVLRGVGNDPELAAAALAAEQARERPRSTLIDRLQAIIASSVEQG
jgi:hypothetical protein